MIEICKKNLKAFEAKSVKHRMTKMNMILSIANKIRQEDDKEFYFKSNWSIKLNSSRRVKFMNDERFPEVHLTIFKFLGKTECFRYL